VTSSSDGSILVAVVRFGFIYVSHDAGATWVQSSSPKIDPRGHPEIDAPAHPRSDPRAHPTIDTPAHARGDSRVHALEQSATKTMTRSATETLDTYTLTHTLTHTHSLMETRAHSHTQTQTRTKMRTRAYVLSRIDRERDTHAGFDPRERAMLRRREVEREKNGERERFNVSLTDIGQT